jgi:hypothetical protein
MISNLEVFCDYYNRFDSIIILKINARDYYIFPKMKVAKQFAIFKNC